MNIQGSSKLTRSFLRYSKILRDLRVVIFFSLTEAPLPDPTPTHPKRTRNGPKNGAKRTQTEPNGAEMDRHQALSGGTARGVCRDGGGVGVVREKENHYLREILEIPKMLYVKRPPFFIGPFVLLRYSEKATSNLKKKKLS